LRMSAAAAAAALLRIAGYGVQGLASGNNAFWPLFYAIPLLGAVLALAIYADWMPRIFAPAGTATKENR